MSFRQAQDTALNRLLLDNDRENLNSTVNLMTKLCPEMMARKFPRANVQQAFVLDTVCEFALTKTNTNILSVGCFEDTAYESLKALDFQRVLGIDPSENGIDVELYTRIQYPELFDIVFSTSVIEHVQDDELFLQCICQLVKPGGYGILTMDYKDGWKPGDRLPYTDIRLYTLNDLTYRLQAVLTQSNCKLVDTPTWEGTPDFEYDGCLYSFATFVFQKGE